jgi:serine/threonine protein phosphatase PrpC
VTSSVLSAGAATDTGRVRTTNEDSVLVAGTVFAVADGMGGHLAGDVASALATTRLSDLGSLAETTPDDVVAALDAANADILAAADPDSRRLGMGTTVTGLCLVRVGGAAHWLVFNIGDSRVYRLAGEQFARLTVDHSEVEELVTAGRITSEQARSHPLRNVVTRALGTNPAPVPDLWVFPCTPGERFLVCSDGLTTELDDDEITSVLRSDPDPQSTADVLVARAVAAGGRDNVTAVVVDLPAVAEVTEVDGRTAPRVRIVPGSGG